MIRVLHFANIINRFDIVDTVLTRLDRSKFDVFALTGQPSRQIIPFTNGEQYSARVLGLNFSRKTYPQMFMALVREIRRFRPDILQAHHFDENVIASAAARLLRIPCYIIGRHYSDHIYFLTRGAKQKAFLSIEGFCNNTAKRITVPTEGVARLLTIDQGVPAEKVAVIPFGLDFNKYKPSSNEAPLRLRSEFGLEGKYVALACSRLNPEKGLEYLLNAVPQLRSANNDFRLVIVGSGDHESVLRRQSHELGIDEIVQFVGWRNDAMDWIAMSDLVVHPAFCESWCQVLFEALAFGKPVVMTPVGAAPEVIGNNERGRLVPAGDSSALAASIEELMADRDLGIRLAESGRAYIHQNMSAELSTRRYEKLYENALSAGR